MAKTVTTRLDDEYIKKIDVMATKRGIDRSSLLRLLLLNSLNDFTIKESMEAYGAGRITLWEAAHNCNLTLWEMILKIKREGVRINYNIEDLEKDLSLLNG